MRKLVVGTIAAVFGLVSIFSQVVHATEEESLGELKQDIQLMSNFALSASTAACIYNDLVRKKVRRIREVWISTLPLYAVYAIKIDGESASYKWRRHFSCLQGIKNPIRTDDVLDQEIVLLHRDIYMSKLVPSFAKHNLKAASKVLSKVVLNYCVAAKGPAFRHTYLLVFPLEVVAQKEKRFNKEEWQISIKQWRWGYQIGCFKTEAERQSALYKAAIKLGIVTPKRKQLPQRKGKGRSG